MLALLKTTPRSKLGAIMLALMLLLPFWSVGIFGRGYWKPDEPREADIVWRMNTSGLIAVPHLADAAFVEKPPLYYWIASPFMTDPLAPAWRARLPNLMYAAVTAICLVLLMFEMGVGASATAAVVLCCSMLQLYQVSIWLATDAALVAATAVTLLGMYRAYHTDVPRRRLANYVLMHCGLALGFMTKNAAAWLVPGCAFIALVVSDRNYRELLRWQLYAGILVEVCVIGAWIAALYRAPQGAELVHQSLWMNGAGRFLPLHSTAGEGLDYSAEHRNWIGKYVLEAPMYVFPWIFLVAAMVRRAFHRMRSRTMTAGWKFCVATFVPSFLVLSIAHTARGIYVAPLLLVLGLALSISVSETYAEADDFDRRMIRWSARLLQLFGATLLCAIPFVVLYANRLALPEWPIAVGAAVIVVALVLARGCIDRTNSVERNLLALYAIYAVLWFGAAAMVFPALNRQQELQTMARAIGDELHGRPLALILPDETTRATFDLARLRIKELKQPQTLASDLSRLLAEQQDIGVLALSDLRRGPVSDWLTKHGILRPRRDSHSQVMETLYSVQLVIEQEFQVPDGRRYVLLRRNPSPLEP